MTTGWRRGVGGGGTHGRGGLLGYSKEEIAKLYANDVIGNGDHYDTVPG